MIQNVWPGALSKRPWFLLLLNILPLGRPRTTQSHRSKTRVRGEEMCVWKKRVSRGLWRGVIIIAVLLNGWYRLKKLWLGNFFWYCRGSQSILNPPLINITTSSIPCNNEITCGLFVAFLDAHLLTFLISICVFGVSGWPMLRIHHLFSLHSTSIHFYYTHHKI
jgi:predicted secreted protein